MNLPGKCSNIKRQWQITFIVIKSLPTSGKMSPSYKSPSIQSWSKHTAYSAAFAFQGLCNFRVINFTHNLTPESINWNNLDAIQIFSIFPSLVLQILTTQSQTSHFVVII